MLAVLAVVLAGARRVAVGAQTAMAETCRAYVDAVTDDALW